VNSKCVCAVNGVCGAESRSGVWETVDGDQGMVAVKTLRAQSRSKIILSSESEQ
jgi:hypothetical protein